MMERRTIPRRPVGRSSFCVFCKGRECRPRKARNQKLPMEKRLGKNPAAAMECAPSRGDVPAFIKGNVPFLHSKNRWKGDRKMTMTRKKKLLIFLIPAAVAVIAAVVVTVILLNRPQPPQRYLLDISAYNNASGPVFVVQGGLEEWPVPLPQYRVAETAPEGYTQVSFSSQTANRFSYEYQDVYFTPAGSGVYLRQQPAGQNMEVGFPAQTQRAEFAGMEIIYGVGEDSSTAAWICGDTLFTLDANQPLNLEEMLAFVNLVDYSSAGAPQARPLEFIEGGVQQFGNYFYSQSWMVGGNPQLPQTLDYYSFAQIPEGYTETAAVTSYVLPADQLAQQGIGAAPDWCQAYESENGTVTLTNGVVDEYPVIFSSVPYINDPVEIEEVTVNGMEGRLYCGASFSELVLLGDYLYIDLTYEGRISREDFLQLAELVGK